MKATGENFFDLSCRILEWANREIPQMEFLEGVLKVILNFSDCNAALLWLANGKECRCVREKRGKSTSWSFKIIDLPSNLWAQNLESFLALITESADGTPSAFKTPTGSIWISDVGAFLMNCPDSIQGLPREDYFVGNEFRSVAFIPIAFEGGLPGLLQMASRRKADFRKADATQYEGVGQIIGVSLKNRQIRSDLTERLKELTCLYSIMQLSDQPERSLDEMLEGAVALLPPAWQFPDIASARIIFDERPFSLPGFQKSGYRQAADLVVKGKRRGSIEVVYTEDKPNLDGNPFLKEERKLIENIGRQLSFIIERRLYKEEKTKLLDQIRHADRLAIIGQLSAAVAHELNEPLSHILGFAQLALKSEGIPEQPRQDIQKILDASLHSREIIKKLLAYARQDPPKKPIVNLNRVLEETIYFFESRCAKEGIDLELELASDLPEIRANAGQLMQVTTNLVVNAMQAMPGGGTLTLETSGLKDHVLLSIEDTGIGMSRETKEKIFTPFFTNKRPGVGTGLGLPVVHEIVIAHGGSIKVRSRRGRGTRFDIRLPVNGPKGIEKDGEKTAIP